MSAAERPHKLLVKGCASSSSVLRAHHPATSQPQKQHTLDQAPVNSAKLPHSLRCHKAAP
jgi:hypothetical protein